jgi:hypothetical protein
VVKSDDGLMKEGGKRSLPDDILSPKHLSKNLIERQV